MVGLIILILGWIFVIYELWRAPQLDNNGNVIKPTKSFKNLFKK